VRDTGELFRSGDVAERFATPTLNGSAARIRRTLRQRRKLLGLVRERLKLLFGGTRLIAGHFRYWDLCRMPATPTLIRSLRRRIRASLDATVKTIVRAIWLSRRGWFCLWWQTEMLLRLLAGQNAALGGKTENHVGSLLVIQVL
jgi:hypothetical protein